MCILTLSSIVAVPVQIAPLLMSQPLNQNQSIDMCYIGMCILTFSVDMYIDMRILMPCVL